MGIVSTPYILILFVSFLSITGGLSHASPKVKEETLGWLRTAVCEEPKPTLSKLAPLLLQPASKCAEEATPSLREAALAFMVAFAIQAPGTFCHLCSEGQHFQAMVHEMQGALTWT
eukprot:1161776-Pelagomonas_calceolata.AAC.3